MISLAGSVAKDTPANYNTRYGNDKSIVDDFVASSYCKCESNLVLRSTEVFAAFLRFVLPCFKIYFTVKKKLLGVSLLCSDYFSFVRLFQSFVACPRYCVTIDRTSETYELP